MKSLTDSIKGELFGRLLNSIDLEFSAEVLTPPPTDPALLKMWADRMIKAINNNVITWEQFFALFPPGVAKALKTRLVELLKEKKENR